MPNALTLRQLSANCGRGIDGVLTVIAPLLMSAQFTNGTGSAK
jgi:hypothetical protein